MRQLVEVKEGIITDDSISFIIEAAEPLIPAQAAGRMIADSDNRAFVYLMDAGSDYLYVQFSEHTWPVLTQAIHRREVPLLKWGKQEVPLQNFREELWMLVENIEGNDNYGEAFRTAVEKSFYEALASRAQ